ncbi:MAG: leucine-rich repeat protein [Oscillospiraceae bacterium]|nr:leucine-rich repeat protein [Oscillospiraceae bacterium]
MKKRHFGKRGCSLLVLLAAVLLLFATLAQPVAQAVSYEASFIKEYTGDLKVNYRDYLDSSVMQKLPDTIKADDEISVIIALDEQNLLDAYEATDKAMSFSQFALESKEAAEIISKRDSRKAKILAALDEAGVAYATGEEYSAALNGFELVIQAKDFDATCQSLGEGAGIIVGEEYKVAETKLVENKVNVYDTGIFKSEGSGYDGSGMVVAVLDTGLDAKHTAFSVNNFTSQKLGLTYDEVSQVIGNTTAATLTEGLTVDDVFINNKVPFGYDYADKDPDPYSTHNNHGTHVSGVIVGKDDTITGVAPNAQLVAMKIFSDVMDTARSAWILAALEDCVVLGVDVINMSLGTACGFSRESDEEILNGVYDRIREAGISIVVAASNSYSSAYGSEANGNLPLTSNPDTGTVGSPSTYEGAMSVASIDGTPTPYLLYGDTIIYFQEANNGAAEELNFFDRLLGDANSKEFEYVVIPGIGRSADYTGLDVNGKIVLVRRGDNTFEEKAMIAENQGAAGIIIYNNVSGEIKMNVGNAKLAVCSISQDDGELLAAQSGTLKISRDQASGPFITDFSSWGPTPDLKIKPELTAHGGNILSSITGGGYDRLSGTSMACPNLAGVMILMRQYVVENFPEIANDNIKVSAMVNQLLMSTADIILNTNGQPYAVRKQGAGLANLMNALNTDAYITTKDETGAVMDKTKIELGDDKEKNGVYTLKFTVNNFGDKDRSYTVGTYVMTEGVSDTKTAHGKTTVTEVAHILEGAGIKVTVGGEEVSKVSVKAGGAVDVTVTITLTDENKAYLNESFENGMYVEGFVTLENADESGVDLSVPYLAFYGDWTQAPMFDLDYYETNADELDDALSFEDKTMADAYSTRPIGGVESDYVSYLGTYYFLQDPEDIVISASRDYIALSNQEGTIHSLRFVWAGLLRSAERIEISITDDVTGEVIFETVDTDVRKSYGDGGSIYPANIEIEFDTQDYNLANNTKYTVKLVGYMDYDEGALDTNKKNTFEFPLVVDFEAPALTDVEFYYEYDKTLKKNRLYAKMAIYDNHYAMAAQVGCVVNSTDEEGNAIPELKNFEQYMTPVYSQCNSTTYVTYELTDYIYQIKENSLNKNTFAVTCYDYALNYATYEIGLPDDYVDFYFDGLEEGLTLSPNEVYSLEPMVYPSTSWGELLEFTSSKPNVVRVVNNKLVAVNSGKAVVKVRDPETNKSLTFNVTVLKDGDEGFQRFDKPVVDIFRVDGYNTVNAYYVVDNEEKDIGDTGDTRYFEGKYNLSMYPSETVQLNYTLSAYFPKDTAVAFETSNDSIVKVDENGAITAVAEGFASVTVKVMQDGKSTYYSESISVEVKDPFLTTGASLTHYYGNGGVVTFPEDLTITEIGNFAFSNFEYIEKTQEELEFDDAEAVKQWFIGNATITKVVIPEGVEKIGAYAFANLTALEEIVLPSTLESIEYGAFYGCTSLEKITFSGENNLKIISQNAFERCDLQGTLQLPSICVISDYAFAGNQKLESVETSDALQSIGQYAFAGCKKLSKVVITAQTVKYGMYAFTDCEALTEFYVNAAVLPEGMFYECKNLESVTIGPEVNDIGAFAFRDTNVSIFNVSAGNTTYKVQNAEYILSADEKTLVAVAATLTGEFDGLPVTGIAKGAFSHNRKITSVNLPAVTWVGEYGFGSSDSITAITLGELTDIGEYAFFETGITQLPKFTAETKIGRYAFSHTKLTSVTIPSGMEIPEGAFSECMALTSVTVGDDVVLGKFAFQVSVDNVFRVLNYDEDGEKYFYYDFNAPLKELTIGKNVTIGDNAFANAANLTAVTLGEGAQIGKQAFYNCTDLAFIDLSKAISIGDYAFSGDEYYICLDENMQVAAVSKDGQYLTTEHASALKDVDLSSATGVGEYAFALCRSLTNVKLGDGITELKQYTFAGCTDLASINLDKVITIGDYCFMENEGITAADLSAATNIGEYAFVNSKLTAITLKPVTEESPDTVTVGEGAFAYCALLTDVKNMASVSSLGDYAFAYAGVVEADLSNAAHIGTQAFIKEEKTAFKVILGEKLVTLGDNPFAMCDVGSFHKLEETAFNGTVHKTPIYTYDISETVKVIDGSLYCKIKTGLELITYAGVNQENVQIADGTVRITAMTFAGSDVKMVTLPYTVAAIGHKAFYDCDKLETVVFQSYEAPILEEEFDPAYYECFEHLPGSGDYGTYVDYDGNEVQIGSMEMLPYFMWNATGGMYSNVYYGANFVDYVGYVDSKLMLVHPVNGQHYDTYIMSRYFDRAVEGAAAADDVTLAAIQAINEIPERVVYENKAVVEAARAAYNKIATLSQQSLVSNYDKLLQAEQRIIALTPVEESVPVVDEQTEPKNYTVLIIVAAVVVLVIAAAVFILLRKRELAAAIWSRVKSLTGALLRKLRALGRKLKELTKKVFAKKKAPAEETQETPSAAAEEKEEESSEE